MFVVARRGFACAALLGLLSWCAPPQAVARGPAEATTRAWLVGVQAPVPNASGKPHDPVQSDPGASLPAEAALDSAYHAVAERIGRRPELIRRFRIGWLGLALRLTDDEAARLIALPPAEVLVIQRVEDLPLAMDLSPRFLGAETVWSLDPPQGGATGSRGEGVVVGIIDGGVDTTHPSFADVTEDGYRHRNPLGPGRFAGWCAPGDPHAGGPWACNDKLIGLYSWPESGDDPRDDQGHGTHTAAIAVGNPLAEAWLDAPIGRQTRAISGIAPRANLISYDVCRGSGCPTSAILAAIEQAMQDGVDVLSVSIALGQADPWRDPVQRALLAARAAGISVAVAAGNAGTEASVSSPAPWLLSVGASTHGRDLRNALKGLEGGGGAAPDLTGHGATGGYGPARLLVAAGLARADGGIDDGRCGAPLAPGTALDAIVVCVADETIGGATAGAAVMAGGAGGLVLLATATGAEAPEAAFGLPTVTLDAAATARLRVWLATATAPRGSIAGAAWTSNPERQDLAAAFSSRGPARLSVCCRRPGLDQTGVALDILKPDLVAPGVAVLSAAPGDGHPDFAVSSGSSMAAPQVAGGLALLAALHPAWSAAERQSALLLGAAPLRDTGGGLPALVAGAGRLNLAAAATAGLVLDETPEALLAADPSVGGDPRRLNLAGLVDGHCRPGCRFERRLRSATGGQQSWTATSTVRPSGALLGLRVRPERFTLAAGESVTLTIEVELDPALAPEAWMDGVVTLVPDDPRRPSAGLTLLLGARGVQLPPAINIRTDRQSGRIVVAGARALAAAAGTVRLEGLTRGQRQRLSLAQDPTPNDPYDGAGGTWTGLWPSSLGEPRDRLIAEIAASDARDLDLFLGLDRDGDGAASAAEQRCASNLSGAVELCEVATPEAGTWWVHVQNWQASGAPLDAVTLWTAAVGAPYASAAAADWTAGAPASDPWLALRLDWSLPDAEPGGRWYGLLRAADADGRDLAPVPVDLLLDAAVEPTPTPPRPSETATPGATATTGVTVTAEATVTVASTATPPAAPPATATSVVTCVCRAAGSAPPPELARALADPPSVAGWGRRANPNLPPGPFNPPRSCLSLSRPAMAWHPLSNSLVFRAGCP